LLYDDDALDEALAIGQPFSDPASWRRGMEEAARRGLAGTVNGAPIAKLAARALALATESLGSGAACAGTGDGVAALAKLSQAKGLPGVTR
jgi:gamma-glutamylcysteine synthetase